MKKIILVPDSFKGTMTSAEICTIMATAIEKHCPQAKILQIPIADGGEGTVDCFLTALGGEKILVPSKGPYLEDRMGFYGLLPDGTAVIEMAACAGLPLVGENKAAEKTTTYGVGLLMADALQSGCKRIILGLGGSATNDGGVGAAAALGIKFLNKNKQAFLPRGETLKEICFIDASERRPELDYTELIVICDIDNPLYGPQGAAFIFAPQKGASPKMVQLLDQGLAHLALVTHQCLGISIDYLPGAGAAGGMGGGMVAFLGGRLQMGIDTVLDAVNFDCLLADADLVFTGEGCLDAQSLRGKVVLGVAKRTKKSGVPLYAIVGEIANDIQDIYDLGVTGIFSTIRRPATLQELSKTCREDLSLTMDNLMRVLKS